jgi:hypothetical protein
MSRRWLAFLMVVLVASPVYGPRLLAQSTLTPVAQGAAQPVLQLWSFGEGVRTGAGTTMTAASQLAVPLGGRFDLSGRRIALHVDGALIHATVSERDSLGAPVRRSLTGITDLRTRIVWRLAGDRLALTAGANLPVGTTGLDGEQARVLQVVGAPALEARVPVLGVGPATTIGLVAAAQRAGWAWAAGAAFERRAQYTPLDRAAVGGTSGFDLDPGDAIHLSMGGDGLVGPHRVSLTAALVLYSDDRLVFGPSGGAGEDASSTSIRLGPLVTAAGSWQVAAPRFRELTLGASLRHRGAFAGENGATVAGSSGQYFDVRTLGVLGPPGRIGIVLGADLLQQTGLPVDRGVIGAGLTGIAGTVGLDFVGDRRAFRPTVRVMAGSLRAGSGTVGITSVAIGGAIHAR